MSSSRLLTDCCLLLGRFATGSITMTRNAMISHTVAIQMASYSKTEIARRMADLSRLLGIWSRWDPAGSKVGRRRRLAEVDGCWDEEAVKERISVISSTDKNAGICLWAAGMVVRLWGIILMLMSDWEWFLVESSLRGEGRNGTKGPPYGTDRKEEDDCVTL